MPCERLSHELPNGAMQKVSAWVGSYTRTEKNDFDKIMQNPMRIKKETLHGWIGRDIDGDLYFGELKPRKESGMFVNYGHHSMELDKHRFPEIKHENFPVQATITIEIEIEQ